MRKSDAHRLSIYMMKASLGFPLAKVYSKRADHARNSVEIREARESAAVMVLVLLWQLSRRKYRTHQFLRSARIVPTRFGFYSLSFSTAVMGTVNRKLEPLPASDSTQMRPSARSRMRLQMASPIPVPAVFALWSRRLKMPKIWS